MKISNKNSKILVMLLSVVFLSCLIYFYRQGYVDHLYFRVKMSRLIVLLGFALLSIIAYRHKTFVIASIKEYFNGKEYPTNIAIFRIIFFSYLFSYSKAYNVITFSKFSRELLFPPTGTEWLMPFLPLNVSFATISFVLFKILTLMCAVGLFYRFSAIALVIVAYYVLGVPQFFGKVVHYHHLMWFMMILSVSKAADVYSLDSLIRKFILKGKGVVSKYQSSVDYALPIRFIWLLMGVLYFFPGYWKVWANGFDWILSENLKAWLYQLWFFNETWEPLFRIDRYPFIYKMSAFMTVLIEMGFIFFILFPKTRILAALGGIGFHLSTNAFMAITFKPLLICYTIFLPWHRIIQFFKSRFKKDAHLEEGTSLKIKRPKNTPLVLMGVMLIVTNIAFGFKGIKDGWPFANYPTFEWLQYQEINYLEMEFVYANGESELYTKNDFRKAIPKLHPERIKRMIRKSLRIKDIEKRNIKFEALLDLIKESKKLKGNIQKVYFFDVRYNIDPDVKDNVLTRNLIYISK